MVESLRALALSFGEADAARKAAALASCADRAIDDADVLLAYHDCLLCLAAYPQNGTLLRAAQRQLREVARAARRLMAAGPRRVRARLANTGVAGTEVTVGFGWDIVCWLVERFPGRADVDSFGDDGLPLAEVLAAALPPIESELVAADEPALEWLDRASAGCRGTRLAWLVAAFRRLPCSDAVREQLFDALRPFIVLRLGASTLSRTFVRGLPVRTHFHRGELLRRVDLPALLAAPLPPLRRLSKHDREQVVDAGRGMLASLGRETDAITLADLDEVAWQEVGRGVTVALYPMRPDRRSPLDSHVGMMLFKNRVPVGYGGGWPFAGTCRIGVNIFPAFRGGESTWLFAQALRVYGQRFAVDRFVVEPTQFGGGDRDGLASGAFWFYYRLGFRPLDPRAARLAADENARMRGDPGYRTPVATLRRFTGGDLALQLREDAPACDAPRLSDAVSAWIARHHRGDRDAAESAAVAALSRVVGPSSHFERTPAEAAALRSLALLFAQIPDLARWRPRERRALAALIRAKASDELRFQRLLARQRRLRTALAALAARASP